MINQGLFYGLDNYLRSRKLVSTREGAHVPAKKVSAKKNPPRLGRKLQDKRGKTAPYRIHLLPVQMKRLTAIAKDRGYRNVSRMLADLADGK